MVSANLNKLGFESTHHPAYTIGMLTDNKFGDAQPLSIAYQKIDENLQNIEGIPIITGFIGKNLDGRITTLGRGGSDFTAAIVGASINADEIQIWTDVDGVMTTDPRICSNVQPISEMTFNEAAELAYFGAKVLHPRTIIPAVEKNINVVVKNTMNQDHPGTTIVNNTEDESIVTSISIKRNVMILRIESARMLNAHGFLARIFSIFEKYEVSVDMIATSEVSVSMTLNSDTYTSLIEELEELGNVSIRNDVSIICVVGRNLRNNNRIQSEIFSCIENEGINVRMISQGASLINVGFVIDEENGDKAVRLLHERFIENGY
ncbi:hypothetical protein C0585_04180 [Candidatus Woesearchaeota archaeon]|nr:MAG: hypothetical protein C0585_04180 [Candidatus Woesearchaeota archaeon]